MSGNVYFYRSKETPADKLPRYGQDWDTGVKYITTVRNVRDIGKQYRGIVHFDVHSSYDFCCGKREFGHISWNYDNSDTAEHLYTAVMGWINETPQGNSCCCLDYTEIVFKNGDPASPITRKFLEMFPGAERGKPWYNRNSGNWICQWTIPVNQNERNDDDD